MKSVLIKAAAVPAAAAFVLAGTGVAAALPTGDTTTDSSAQAGAGFTIGGNIGATAPLAADTDGIVDATTAVNDLTPAQQAALTAAANREAAAQSRADRLADRADRLAERADSLADRADAAATTGGAKIGGGLNLGAGGAGGVGGGGAGGVGGGANLGGGIKLGTGGTGLLGGGLNLGTGGIGLIGGGLNLGTGGGLNLGGGLSGGIGGEAGVLLGGLIGFAVHGLEHAHHAPAPCKPVHVVTQAKANDTTVVYTSASKTLPQTGVPAAALAGAGIATIVAGAGVTFLARRREA